MKRICFYVAAVFCGLTMTTSCTKENLTGLSGNALEIFAEKSGTKTTVNGTTVKWEDGDEVWVNNAIGTVTENNGHWYAEGPFSTDNDFNVFYPATLATATGAENLSDATATVVFPSRYASSFDGNDQEISLPMAARSTGGTTGVTLKHLSAAINLEVTNNTGSLLLIDSVSISSANVNLCGQASVDLTGADPIVAATGTGDETVTVYFTTPVSIDNDDSKTLQVPMIPSTSDLGDLTVKVYSHDTLASLSIQYLTFTKSKSGAPSLGRNAVASLPVSMTTNGSEMTSHILGAFSVSATKKVYFSMGNLQYKKGETFPWRFALNQYDRMEVNGTWDTSTWVGLFGWGTWTGDTPNPLNTSTHDHDYQWNSDDFVKEAELANVSQRGFDWRTLSGDEFEFVVDKRSCGFRFAKAKVHDVEGLILFPDGFSLPAGVTTLVAKNQKKMLSPKIPSPPTIGACWRRSVASSSLLSVPVKKSLSKKWA